MAPTYYNTTDTAVVVRDDGRAVPARDRYTGGATPQIDAAIERGDLVDVTPAPTRKSEKE